jgi:hypothetical protein
MPRPIRRSFVAGLTLCIGVCIVQQIFPQVSETSAASQTPAAKRPLRMLALGDSVMWGQGLHDQNKFSYRIREWLCGRRGDPQCRSEQSVQLHVEAHSGAVLSKPDDDRKKEEEDRFKRATYPLRYAGEVNHGYPTLWGQLELAQRHYRSNSIPAEEVDLVLLNGCINDINASRVLTRFGGDLKELSEKYCWKEMKDFLPAVADAFPKARIVVPGYFPLISEETPPHILYETLKEWLFPRKTKTKEFEAFEEEWEEHPDKNALVQPEKVTRTMTTLVNRSKEFVKASNEALVRSVEHLNKNRPPLATVTTGSPVPPEASARVLFVAAAPFGPAYGATDSFLWKLGRREPSFVLLCADKNLANELLVDDQVQKVRPCMCDQAGRTNDPICIRAGTFHPNTKGADVYYQAIKATLEKIIDHTGWLANN